MASKLEKRQAAIAGRGVIIDSEKGLIYRLAIAPDGKYRVAENKFDIKYNTVLGPALRTWDFMFAQDAIAIFNRIKRWDGLVWREDDRVFYDPKCNA